MTSTSTGSRFGGLLLRGLLTAIFVTAAGMKFAAVPFEVAGFARFGYPLWFMYMVGAAQLLGAALLWCRGTVAYGALLLAAVMVGAAFSHLRAGDPVAMALPALVLLGLLAGLAVARRGELVPSGLQVASRV
ncbi:DoxX family protein [Methylobacterium sp. 17Sr1-1]|uniref:DoxX family protein n=1 Tax=Methylobacterium sp. 17Sr1-1 TaxID=2202826 RepID=UPI000D6EF9B9|nr:DoxX family protein [Methylobacterium sp. 17Sr1-1]AWN54112.1 DoxX family protein [Methylobacterium sp. 17Sr1-1]